MVLRRPMPYLTVVVTLFPLHKQVISHLLPSLRPWVRYRLALALFLFVAGFAPLKWLHHYGSHTLVVAWPPLAVVLVPFAVWGIV